MSSPIRIGFIGLGSHTRTNVPGLWCSIAHLPYLLASPKYQITAICNSTVASAQVSISYHNLGPSVKAYGNAEDLARDPNVDMVIISVKFGMHYALSKPATLAGKGIFVEWPLATSTAEVEELAQLAKAHRCKTIVGLQARASPLVIKLKTLVSGGKMGKALSLTVTANFAGLPEISVWPKGAEYYLNMGSGGNAFTIFFFGHFLDCFVSVMGGFQELRARMKCDFPEARIVDGEGREGGKDEPGLCFAYGNIGVWCGSEYFLYNLC